VDFQAFCATCITFHDMGLRVLEEQTQFLKSGGVWAGDWAAAGASEAPALAAAFRNPRRRTGEFSGIFGNRIPFYSIGLHWIGEADPISKSEE
jgi:hypothetical protein